MSGGRLAGKVAIVTGAGSVGPGWGNGRAMAVRFAEEGAKVFACDRDLVRLEETVARVEAAGGTLIVHSCDVTDSASIQAMVAACLKAFGRIDVLVNNVGGSAAGGPVEMSEEVWDAQVDFNLKSVFLGCKHVLPVMEAQGGGVIINIASTSGLRWTGEARLAGQRAGGDVEAILRQRQKRIPLAFAGDGRDTANAALFLASDEARFITGTEIVVDGGMTVRCD
ncbi:MAG: SDR family oxidoreductase [Proteobacteria bacterium]|nr:SDR family oxidoreductase [Pseudomonadota bacterium]